MPANTTNDEDAMGFGSEEPEPLYMWPKEVTCERKYYSSLPAGALAALAV